MAEKMIPYKERTIRELKEEYAAQKARYDTFAAQGLKLDMSRGKPSTEQVATTAVITACWTAFPRQNRSFRIF